MNETCEHTILVDKDQITSSTLHLQQKFAQLNKKLSTIVHVHYLDHVHVHCYIQKTFVILFSLKTQVATSLAFYKCTRKYSVWNIAFCVTRSK